MKDIYETERLILQISNERLTKQVKNYYVKNKQFLQDTEPAREDNFYTDKYIKKMLARENLEARNLISARFWMIQKESKELIGMVGLNNIIMGVFCSSYLAYKSDNDYLNQGFVTEAVRKLTDIAFHELGLHRIEANIMPRNKASLRVVEKNGFVYEGLSRKYLKINGVWEDHVHMVKINDSI